MSRIDPRGASINIQEILSLIDNSSRHVLEDGLGEAWNILARCGISAYGHFAGGRQWLMGTFENYST